MKTCAKPLSRLILLAGLAACWCCAAQTAWADAVVYQKVLPSTVWVLARNSDGTSSGTGVLVDAGRKWVITNAHVVGDARNAVIFFPDIQDGRPKVDRSHYLDNVTKLGVRGRVIGVDRRRDLAVVELNRLPEGARAIEMAAQSVGQGEKVHSIGNPGSTEALWVYTSGTVRAVYMKEFGTRTGEHKFTVVETQAPINPGDSGGPVVNNEGQLVAVAQAISAKGRLVSYCVDISEVKDYLDDDRVLKPAPRPVEELLKKADLEYTQHQPSGHFEVQMEPNKDEKLSVFITKDIEYYEQADVRKIWTLTKVSPEAPSAEIALKLLQQSARTKLGAWTVEQNQGGEYLIVYMVKLDATATANTIKSSMEYVAKLSSAMKKELSPKQQAANASDTLQDWLSN